jgi:hypothetical protein
LNLRGLVISKNYFLFLPSGDLQRQLSDDPITVQLGILIGIFFYADFLGNRLAVVYLFNPNPGGLVANTYDFQNIKQL